MTNAPHSSSIKAGPRSRFPTREKVIAVSGMVPAAKRIPQRPTT